ncbi:MAG TPA: ribosome silencing factor [Chthoniobacteraceae bacterium]|nr:ribosome silencing factor [Chthoniobacteraceae bacterium]
MTSESLAKLCSTILNEKHGVDLVVLDLREVFTFTDFFVICTATSEPHLRALSDDLEKQLREHHGVRPISVDGNASSQWIVIDFSGVVVHLFHESKRSFYGLEDLWNDAPRLELPVPPEAGAA